MPIQIPEKLEEIYGREYNDTFAKRQMGAEIDDESGYRYSDGFSIMDALMNVNKTRGLAAAKYCTPAVRDMIERMVADVDETTKQIFIPSDAPDAEMRRHQVVLSRIATFSGSPKERKVAEEELQRLNLPLLDSFNKINSLNEAMGYLSGTLPQGASMRIPSAYNDAIIRYGYDFSDIVTEIGKTAVTDSIVVDAGPFDNLKTSERFTSDHTRINLPPEEVMKNNRVDYFIGNFSKTFDPIAKKLPAGMDIFDTITIDGVPVKEAYGATIKKLSPSMAKQCLSVIVMNQVFDGGKKIECCPVDETGKVGEPVRVSAGPNMPNSEPRKMNAWQSFWNKRGFYQYMTDRTVRQNRLYKERASVTEARRNAIKENVSRKAAAAKQATATKTAEEKAKLKAKAIAAVEAKEKLATIDDKLFFAQGIDERKASDMGLKTLNRQASRISLARLALLGKGYSLDDIMSETKLNAEKEAVGKEIKAAIEKGDKEYFKDLFETSGKKMVTDLKLPTNLNSREALLREYPKLAVMSDLAVDYFQIKGGNEDTYEANLTPEEKLVVSLAQEKMGSFCSIAKTYAKVLSQDDPLPGDVIKAGMAVNLATESAMSYEGKKVLDLPISPEYKMVPDMLIVTASMSGQLDNIMDGMASYAVSNDNPSPISLGTDLMPIIKANGVKLEKPEMHEYDAITPQVGEKTRQRIALFDDSKKKARAVSPDPKLGPTKAKEYEDLQQKHSAPVGQSKEV